MGGKYAEARETIVAGPERIYGLVSNLPRMGEWSPEAAGGTWVRGATGPAVGARFRGSNRNGWRRWSTMSEVTDARPGERFAFHVTSGPLPVADWAYDFELTDEGTLVTERWNDLRPHWMDLALRPILGVHDRAVHNQRTMALTLTALKQCAERPGSL